MNNARTSLLGVVFFVVLAAAIFTESPPGTDSSPAKVLAYYTDHRNGARVSSVLTVVSVVLGLFFYGMVRDYLRRSDHVRGLASTAFGGAVLFGASGLIGAGALAALTDSPSHLSATAAQSLFLVNEDGGFAFASGGIALMLIGFGLAILKSGLLPNWLGWISFPLALCALVPPASFVGLIGTALWTLIVSIAMYRRQSTAADVRPAAAATG